ncbi:MAG: hypothetical protein ALECFALPRED_001944 [Alectoria fallacina]|uniref:Uncharacterized protein n=1 Tax=Alectoria fallacina TaxID=1903189 RepID=A0A8H3EF67_9LECA|nr:MAG: hypothetical protein ALECFALPRED_001944 [Alectoria fallacina]
MKQLGELRKREALATFLGDKEVCAPEAGSQHALGSAAEDLTESSTEDTSILAPPDSDVAEAESVLAEDDRNHQPFLESTLWRSVIKKFVIDSMHGVFGSREDLLMN